MNSTQNASLHRKWAGITSFASFGAILLTASLMAGCQDSNPTNTPQVDNAHNNALSSGHPSGKCSADSAPVCGMDGVSYLNACAAWDIGKTEVKSQGVCAGRPFDGTCTDPTPDELGIMVKCTSESDPVCGCDGKTYVNSCQALGIGRVNVAHKGECAPIK